jgi:EAL domain-containing protein (putative c-di-GMP-specific phosphodiesterase class I)
MDETITRHGLAAAGFTMELTESSRLSGRGEAALEDVRRMGMKIALDDFGEGADSFARVKDIPAHVLKLDRALLRDVPQRPEANAIVASVLALAKALGMQAIAEGIENDGHRTFLIEQRCPLGQGYRLGRPLPAPRVG